MDWTNYFILISAIASASLIWRNLLLDHPKFDRTVEALPFIGNGLVCGFCAPMWLTFLVVLFLNPLSGWDAILVSSNAEWVVEFIFGWLSVGAGVLLIRFAIIALMDGSAILSHKHRSSHKEE